jgi:adenylate cyclase
VLRSVVGAQGLALDLAWVFRMLIREHLNLSIDRHRQSVEQGGYSDGMVSMAVGFVDLVGFTTRSGSMSAKELGALVSKFETLALDTVSLLGGRLVKFIGSE